MWLASTIARHSDIIIKMEYPTLTSNASATTEKVTFFARDLRLATVALRTRGVGCLVCASDLVRRGTSCDVIVWGRAGTVYDVANCVGRPMTVRVPYCEMVPRIRPWLDMWRSQSCEVA